MYKFNLIFQPHDPRDLHYMSYLTCVPDTVDLSPPDGGPEVYDQQEFGTCTANAAGWLLNYLVWRSTKKASFVSSRMFIYANARMLDGTPLSEDAGTTLRSTFKSIDKNRTLSESKYPYIADNMTRKPSGLDYAIALSHKKFLYMRVEQTLNSIQQCLANGFPIAIGVEVYSSLMETPCIKTGVVPMPNTKKEQLLGGHAVLLVGYDNKTKTFLFLNSWGTAAIGLPNKRGYWQIPYAYVLDANLCADFWTAKLFV